MVGELQLPVLAAVIGFVNARLLSRTNAQNIRNLVVKCLNVAEIKPFSIGNGLLTANGKVKRDLISTRLHNDIEALYQARQAS